MAREQVLEQEILNKVMEYKIPKSTIRSFIDVLKDTKRTLEVIKVETTKEKESV